MNKTRTGGRCDKRRESPVACSNALREEAAFSLVELLAVIALLSILSTLILPSLGTLSGAGMRSASAQLSDIFEQAKTMAIGRNVHVYVGLTQMDPQTVLVGVVSAPSSGGGLTGVTSIYRPTVLKNIEMRDPSQVRDEVSLPLAASNADKLSDSDYGTINVNYKGQAVPCGYVVHFSPDGQATIKQENTSRNIQVGLAPAGHTKSKDLSLIQISGLTGNVSVYLP